jgi:hypothetical protein
MLQMPDTPSAARPIIKAQIVAPPEPRWLVLVMLFVLMGALAVPMLWRSPHFARPTKIVLSVLAFLQTTIVLIILAIVVVWFFGQIAAITSQHR